MLIDKLEDHGKQGNKKGDISIKGGGRGSVQ